MDRKIFAIIVFILTLTTLSIVSAERINVVDFDTTTTNLNDDAFDADRKRNEINDKLNNDKSNFEKNVQRFKQKQEAAEKEMKKDKDGMDKKFHEITEKFNKPISSPVLENPKIPTIDMKSEFDKSYTKAKDEMEKIKNNNSSGNTGSLVLDDDDKKRIQNYYSNSNAPQINEVGQNEKAKSKTEQQKTATTTSKNKIALECIIILAVMTLLFFNAKKQAK